MPRLGSPALGKLRAPGIFQSLYPPLLHPCCLPQDYFVLAGKHLKTTCLSHLPPPASPQDYFVLAGKHLKTTCLSHLPHDFQSVVKLHETMSEGNDLVSPPPMDQHVFCSVLEDVGSIQLNE